MSRGCSQRVAVPVARGTLRAAIMQRPMGTPDLFEQARYTPRNPSVAKLLAEYSSRYMPLFERVKGEWDPLIREFYRNAMGLSLGASSRKAPAGRGKKAAGDAGVPIQIRPDRDDTFLRAVDEMLPDVDFARIGALRELRASLHKAAPHFAGDPGRQRAHAWMLTDIEAHIGTNSLEGPFSTLMNTPGKHRDVFGSYFYADQHVELYYMPLLIYCEYRGIDLQWAIVKVLAHELAHAYHHAGRDSDGRTWPAMPKAAPEVKEGLAEYWSERFVRAHEHAYPALRTAYDGMLEGKSGAYRSVLEWRDDHTQEQVRLAMVMVRKHGAVDHAAFKAMLAEAKRVLG